MPKNDLAYQKVSVDLGYYKSVSSGSGTSGEADKAGVSEPIKMKVAETPARGQPSHEGHFAASVSWSPEWRNACSGEALLF